MEDAQTILVIILSSVLTVFLIAGIVLMVILIKLVRTLRNVAEHAQSVVNNVETAAEVLKKSAGPLAIGKFLMNIANIVNNKKKGK